MALTSENDFGAMYRAADGVPVEGTARVGGAPTALEPRFPRITALDDDAAAKALGLSLTSGGLDVFLMNGAGPQPHGRRGTARRPSFRKGVLASARVVPRETVANRANSLLERIQHLASNQGPADSNSGPPAPKAGAIPGHVAPLT